MAASGGPSQATIRRSILLGIAPPTINTAPMSKLTIASILNKRL
jgi:hypothetical protein